MAKNEYPCTDVQPILNYGHDGSVIVRLKLDANGKLELSTVPLPTGAATAAKQDDGLTQLTTISGKLNTIPADYDYISCGYTGSDITTIVYKTGGAGGTTVMTVDLTYDSNGQVLTYTVTTP